MTTWDEQTEEYNSKDAIRRRKKGQREKRTNREVLIMKVVGGVVIFLVVGWLFNLIQTPSTITPQEKKESIELYTKDISSWRQDEIRNTVMTMSAIRQYDTLSEKDRACFWQEIADEYELSVNQVKACYANREK